MFWGVIWAPFIWLSGDSLNEADISGWCCGALPICQWQAALRHHCRKWRMCKFFTSPCDSNASALCNNLLSKSVLTHTAPSDDGSSSEWQEQSRFFSGAGTKSLMRLVIFPPHRGRRIGAFFAKTLLNRTAANLPLFTVRQMRPPESWMFSHSSVFFISGFIRLVKDLTEPRAARGCALLYYVR